MEKINSKYKKTNSSSKMLVIYKTCYLIAWTVEKMNQELQRQKKES